MWSGILQNQMPMLGLGMKVPRPPLAVVPSALPQPPPNFDDEEGDDDED